MDAFEVDGEFVEIAGPRQLRIRSRSQHGVWYALDLDDGSCTCKGFQVRKQCRHMDLAIRFARGLAIPESLQHGDLVRVELATGRYQMKELASERVMVGITVALPRWKLTYELAANVKEAAPVGFKNDEREEFAAKYALRLDSFGVGYFRRRFSEIATAADNPRLALLCYEDLSLPDEFCHRRLFAEWWEQHTGDPVPELGPVPQATLLS